MPAGDALVNLLEVEDMALLHGLARTALGPERSGPTRFWIVPTLRMPFGHPPRNGRRCPRC